MKHIESPENPLIKKAMKLKQRKAREKEGLYLIEGLNLCREALSADVNIEVLLIRQSEHGSGGNGEYEDLLAQSAEKGLKTVGVEDGLYNKLMETETPQGIAAMVRYRTWDPDSFFAAGKRGGQGNILVLDRIQDPGNAGTLLRTAEAAGCQGVLALKGTVDLYSPKVVRAAAGSLFRLPLLFTANAKEAVRLLHSHGKRVVVATPYCDNFHFETQLDRNAAFVIGNEAGGVSTDFLEMSDCRVKIPMCEPVESLNAAVAAGILMYESLRQNFEREAEDNKQSCRQS
ncbi:MAG: TrmH family RNA methyltransferase [Anaerovoracaceae bacterium]